MGYGLVKLVVQQEQCGVIRQVFLHRGDDVLLSRSVGRIGIPFSPGDGVQEDTNVTALPVQRLSVQRLVQPAGLAHLAGLACVLLRGHSAAEWRVDEARILTRRQRHRASSRAGSENYFVASFVESIEWSDQFFAPGAPFRKNAWNVA